MIKKSQRIPCKQYDLRWKNSTLVADSIFENDISYAIHCHQAYVYRQDVTVAQFLSDVKLVWI